MKHPLHTPNQERFSRGRKLLVATLILLGLGLSLACVGLSSGNKAYFYPKAWKQDIPPSSVQGAIYGEPRHAAPGQSASRRLLTQGIGPFNLTWTPPPGATNLTFDPPPEPGGPPYRWNLVDAFVSPLVRFDLPPLPAGRTTMMVADTLQAAPSSHPEAVSAAAFYTLIDANLPKPTPQAPQSVPAQALPAAAGRAPAAGTAWVTGFNIFSGSTALTTQLCQDAIDLLRSEDAFVAVRLPTAATAITEGVSLPVLFPPQELPGLLVYENSPTGTIPVASATWEYRPERLTFLENALPGAPDEHWVALGLADTPVTCPAGLNVPADKWRAMATLLLDLSRQPDNCTNCVLPYYLCYAGQAEPLAGAMLRLLPGMPGAYQGEGLTCAGPGTLQLNEDGWQLLGTPWSYISPTVTTTVALRHSLFNGELYPLEVQLDYTAPVGSDWALYQGSEFTPSLDAPLIQPVNVFGTRFVWLVGSIPAGTPAGTFGVVVTATAAATPTIQVAYNTVWVGDWVAPPPMQPPAAPLLLSPPDGGTTGPAVTLSWGPGAGEVPLAYTLELDGQSYPSTNTSHAAELDAGAHAWRARAHNQGGDSPWSELRAFSVSTPVTAAFTAAPASGPAPLTVIFTNTSSGSYTASLWEFGDSLTSTLDSPQHTYTQAGVYTVTLTVSGPGGTDTETRPAYIHVNQGGFKLYLPVIRREWP